MYCLLPLILVECILNNRTLTLNWCFYRLYQRFSKTVSYINGPYRMQVTAITKRRKTQVKKKESMLTVFSLISHKSIKTIIENILINNSVELGNYWNGWRKSANDYRTLNNTLYFAPLTVQKVTVHLQEFRRLA